MSEEKHEGEAPRRMLESLGWLTESLLVPRKCKAIEGVGTGTLVELKAQYYASQEQARQQKERGEPSKGRKRKNEDDSVNPGVLERDRKDRLHLKTKEEAQEAAYIQLEKKAEIYDQLIKGDGHPDEEMIYEVDFLEKRYEQLTDKTERTENTVEEEDSMRKQRRELIMEQAGLTKAGRERAAQIKDARLQQQARRREKLKVAYIRKHMAKMKAKTAQTVENATPIESKAPEPEAVAKSTSAERVKRHDEACAAQSLVEGMMAEEPVTTEAVVETKSCD